MAKRVLVYTNHFYPENFKVNEIAAMFAGEDLEVKVITGVPNYPAGKIYEGYGFFKRNTENIDGISVKRLLLIPRGSGSKFRLIFNYGSYFLSCLLYTLYLAFFKKKYDVVFVHHTSPILIAIPPILYKWLKDPKMILWDLDMWPDTLVALDVLKSKKLISFLESLVTWIYKRYDHILLGSESFVERASYRVNPSKVQYFPNWAEKVFISDEICKMSCPEIKLPKGFKLMYAGNIGEAQDFGNVFKAMELLKEEEVNWLIVGDGRYLKRLQKKVSDVGLENRVTFYGNHPLEMMSFFFSQSNVMFLSLQDKEIFSKTVPAKLQAYMASGKPVAAMISGEGADIIKNANCGNSVASGDYKGFAKIVSAMRLKNGELNDLGLNGKEYYNKNFSIQSRKKQLMEIILD